MNPIEWWNRLWYLLNRGRYERELQREMETHRAMMGAPQDFGNTLRLREEARDVWGWTWLDHAWQDVRYAGRTLRASPGFAFSAWLILSVGIGLNLTLFQLVSVTLLRPLPVRDPHSLVRFSQRSPNWHSSGVPYRVTQFVRSHNNVLSAVLTRTGVDVVWGDDAADRLQSAFVSANWFSELGYGAARGRVFVEEIDEKPDAPPVVVISHRLWQTRLDGDPDVIGRTVRISNRSATIIGVAPASFPGLRTEDPQLWMPIEQIDHFLPGVTFKAAWATANAEMYGRLRSGVSPAAAREGLRPIYRELARQRPNDIEKDAWLEPHTASDRFQTRQDNEQWVVILLAGGLALLVFVVACSNLSSLALSRAVGRVRELSVRAALGASRARVMRQLLAESLVLAFTGALGALVLGYWAAKLIAVLTELPSYLDFTPDLRMMLAALGAALSAMLAMGWLPAWRVSRQDLSGALKDGGQQVSGSLARARLRQVLVALQVAGSCVLLLVAGLMARSLQRLLTADPGFVYENVAVLDPSLVRYGLKGAAARAYWSEVRRSVAAHPETDSVALVSHAPLGNSLSERAMPDVPNLKITVLSADPDFFGLMRIPILAGRTFQSTDGARTSVIISRRLAIEMFGTIHAIGKGYPRTRPNRTIVGVAGDARLIQLQATNVAEEYAPLHPDEYEYLVLLARAKTDAGRLAGPMRRAARDADDRVLAQVRSLEVNFAGKVRAPRLAGSVVMATALLALALACLGIFGLISYAAAQRTREIGIRMALGADRPSIMQSLLRPLTWPVLLGVLLGVAGGTAMGRTLAGSPLYLQSGDAITHTAVLLVFAATAGIAAILPTLRALRADPLQALRHE